MDDTITDETDFLKEIGGMIAGVRQGHNYLANAVLNTFLTRKTVQTLNEIIAALKKDGIKCSDAALDRALNHLIRNWTEREDDWKYNLAVHIKQGRWSGPYIVFKMLAIAPANKPMHSMNSQEKISAAIQPTPGMFYNM